MHQATRALLLAGVLISIAGLSLAVLVPRPAGPERAAGGVAPTHNETYLGCGCFWHVQHEMVTQIEEALLGRKHTSLTAFTGYAGGTHKHASGLVCYHSFSGVGDYGRLGHAEVVSLHGLPDALVPAVANIYFDSICVNGRRRDIQDVGAEYRSLIGLPGGLASPAGRLWAAAAKKRGVRLVAGEGDDEDIAGTVYVMDTTRFPFHQAEIYHQFHDDMSEWYGPQYNAFRPELARADASAGAPSGADAASANQARPGSDSRKLFVGGLPQGSSEEQVTTVFAPHGKVEEVHMIKPNPSSESKRGCCFVTYSTAAEAEAAIKALNGQVPERLGSSMPLLVRVADPPRTREEQRSRQAQQQAQQQRAQQPQQVGIVPGWPGAFGYAGFPPQHTGAYPPAGQAAAPYYVGGAAGPQYMAAAFPSGYGFGMVPQFATQHGEWSEHTDGDGNKYYYNSQSGVSQWEPPPSWPSQQPAAQLNMPATMMYPYAQPVPAGYFVGPAANNGAAGASGGGGGGAAAGGGVGSSGKRGPRGANLALFCIPNAYTDVELHEIARPYGNVVFAQVSRHRDSGLSRGYGFVSFETVEEAEKAIHGIHGMVVQGRALRVEKVKADEDGGGARR